MAVHVLTGDDESLLGAAVSDLVRVLVGDADRSLVVDDFDTTTDSFDIRLVVDAAQTMPFLTDKRVVVVRSADKLLADQVAVLAGYLNDPLPSSELVLAANGRLSKALADAAKAAKAVVTATGAPSSKRDRGQWLDEQLAAHHVRLDGGAVTLLGNWLGEDAGRLRGLLETLVSTYGADKRLGAADIAPFLGEGGGVPPWELTDAIDAGDVSLALRLMSRMMNSGDRHPLQIMAILHNHYVRLLKLDGVDARTESQAMEVLGVKSGFQAKKAMDQFRKLGSGGVRRAVQLLGEADLSMRGQRDLDADLVMEVLVARLARLTPRRSLARR